MTFSRKTPMKRSAFKPKKVEKRPCPTLKDLQEKGLVVKASSLSARPRKRMKPRSPKNVGWYRWAVENVWNKRAHECEVCGCTLEFDGEDPPPIVFSHLLERGSYKRYIRVERNVRIKCGLHHGDWHNKPKEELVADTNPFHLGWRRQFDLEEELKQEANNVRPDKNEQWRKELLDGAASGKYISNPLPPIILNGDAIAAGDFLLIESRYLHACHADDKVIFPDGTGGVVTQVNGSQLTIRTISPPDQMATKADCMLARYVPPPAESSNPPQKP